MKTIKNIDERLTHFQELPPEQDKGTLPSYRKMFKTAVSMSLTKSGDEAIELYQLGLKLSVDKPDIDLEDAEFRLLKEKCNGNPAQWMSHFHAQVMMKIKDSEVIPLEVKK